MFTVPTATVILIRQRLSPCRIPDQIFLRSHWVHHAPAGAFSHSRLSVLSAGHPLRTIACVALPTTCVGLLLFAAFEATTTICTITGVSIARALAHPPCRNFTPLPLRVAGSVFSKLLLSRGLSHHRPIPLLRIFRPKAHSWDALPPLILGLYGLLLGPNIHAERCWL